MSDDIIASSETPAPVPTARPMPERKQSVDLATAQRLEKNLAHRPDKHELIERNILKGER